MGSLCAPIKIYKKFVAVESQDCNAPLLAYNGKCPGISGIAGVSNVGFGGLPIKKLVGEFEESF